MASGADPVGFGLVASLSHPGGNVTGLANFAEMLASKQIDLLREILPHLARFGLLVNVTNQLHVPQLRETKMAAEALGVLFVPAEVSRPDQLDSAFATLGAERVEGLLVPPDTTFYSRRREIADLAAKTRLPAIYGYREHVEVGGLMSYGPDLAGQYRRAASYVDKILKGAQPADLPVEQPTKIELVINLKTATALGLTIPPTLVARADEVIENCRQASKPFGMTNIVLGQNNSGNEATNVRFTPKSGHRNSLTGCLLCAKSGHSGYFDSRLICCSTMTGSVNANVEPWPGCDSTQIRPPCISMMRLDIASPKPVPPFFRVMALSAC
jgi:hypothetical protein